MTFVRPLAWLLLALFLPWVARPADTPEQLRARLESETDLIRKARLAVRLAEVELDAAQKESAAGDFEKTNAHLQKMLDYVEEAYAHLTETKRDPRRNPKGFKETEIKLHAFERRLEDLRASLPLEERGTVEKALNRIREIQQALLNGLMRVKEAKKEKS